MRNNLSVNLLHHDSGDPPTKRSTAPVGSPPRHDEAGQGRLCAPRSPLTHPLNPLHHDHCRRNVDTPTFGNRDVCHWHLASGCVAQAATPVLGPVERMGVKSDADRHYNHAAVGPWIWCICHALRSNGADQAHPGHGSVIRRATTQALGTQRQRPNAAHAHQHQLTVVARSSSIH